MVRALVPEDAIRWWRARRVKDGRVADAQHNVGVLRIQVGGRKAGGVVADAGVGEREARRFFGARDGFRVHKLLVDIHLHVATAVLGTPRGD